MTKLFKKIHLAIIPYLYYIFLTIFVIAWIAGIYLLYIALGFGWGFLFGFSSGEDTSPEPCYNNAPPYC